MDNKNIIEIIKKNIEEVGTIANNLEKYPTIPQIVIDLAVSKTKNLLLEFQMLNKNNAELMTLKFIEDPISVQVQISNNGKAKPEEKILQNVEIIEKEHKPKNETSPNEPKLTHIEKRKEKIFATQLKHEPIKDIKKAINLNEKIWFIKELFNGSIDKYNETLDIINELKSLEEALEYLNNYCKWEENNKTVNDFYEFIYRRFA